MITAQNDGPVRQNKNKKNKKKKEEEEEEITLTHGCLRGAVMIIFSF